MKSSVHVVASAEMLWPASTFYVNSASLDEGPLLSNTNFEASETTSELDSPFRNSSNIFTQLQPCEIQSLFQA